MEYILNNNELSTSDTADEQLVDELCINLLKIRGLYFDNEKHGLDFKSLRESDEFKMLQVTETRLQLFDPRYLKDEDTAKAFWLNVYNSLFIHAIIHAHRDTGFSGAQVHKIQGLFADYRYQIGGSSMSLDEIEHGILRANQPKYMSMTRIFADGDPRLRWTLSRLDSRIHCAFYIGAGHSPSLQVFHGDSVDRELDEAAHRYLRRMVSLNVKKNRLVLPKIFQWYKKDFGSDYGLSTFLRRYLDSGDMKTYLDGAQTLKFDFAAYDWDLVGSL